MNGAGGSGTRPTSVLPSRNRCNSLIVSRTTRAVASRHRHAKLLQHRRHRVGGMRTNAVKQRALRLAQKHHHGRQRDNKDQREVFERHRLQAQSTGHGLCRLLMRLRLAVASEAREEAHACLAQFGDALPEQAFYMVGGIEEAIAHAEELTRAAG